MPKRLSPLLLTVALVTPGIVGLTARPAAASLTLAWSRTSPGWDRSSSPTIADVNGDGTNDIVIGHQDGWLRVLNGHNGANLAGWPRAANTTGSGFTAIDSTPAVADLFKNGHKEIIVGLGSTWAPNQQGGVEVFNADGSVHCRYRTADAGNIWGNTPHPDGYSDAVFSSPAIGDINGDGYPDIVFGAFDLNVHAIDRNCHDIFSDNIEDSVWSSPALYDVNGDGRLDVLIGGDQSRGGPIDWAGGEFRAIAWSPGGQYPCTHCVELWKHQLHDTMWSSPAVGDIDGDGRPEVVVGAGHFYNQPDGHRVYAWHADDGSAVPGWPVTTMGSTMPSPALGDLTGDGIPEVAVGSADGWLRAYRGNGSLFWATRLKFINKPGGPVASPIIADMNGDGHNDVGAGNDWGFFVLNGTNGSILSEVNTFLSYESTGAVGYFGPVDGWRLIVDGFNTPGHSHRIAAYTMPTPGIAPPWPMFRRDAAHVAGPVGKNLLPPGFCRRTTNPAPHPNVFSSRGYWVSGVDGSIYALKGAPFRGNVVGRARGWTVAVAATATGAGYYVLDSAGSIFAFGDARSLGSMAGRRLNAPIVALAPTPTGKGYWLLGRDGGIFGFGDAKFYGSTGSVHLNAPIISMAATHSGRGYWLLGADGGIFGYGDAKFYGSTGSMKLAAPVVSMATAPSGTGYWLIARDGGIFGFHVPFYGSLPGLGSCRAIAGVQIRPSLTGHGYFILTAAGRIFPFGDALAGASAPPLGISNFATDLAVRP